MATRGKRGSKDHYRKQGPPSKTQRADCDQSVDLSSPTIQAFLNHRQLLDNRHDKYERLVKLSRDITVSSKRAIFLLHRALGDEKETILSEAHVKLKEIQEVLFRRIAMELEGEDPHQFTRAYSPGLQEYIEALSFCKYMESEQLIELADVEKDLVFQQNEETDGNEQSSETAEAKSPDDANTDNGGKSPDKSYHQQKEHQQQEQERTIKVFVSPLDYVLGLADLTGELMRLAITSIGKGNTQLPFKVCQFIRQLHNAFVSLGYVNKELPRKVHVLKQSLKKVENACYTIQVRGSEFPKSMLLNLISIGDLDRDSSAADETL